MARAFDDASTQYLINNSAVVSDTPVSMACFAYCDDGTRSSTPMAVAISSATQSYRLTMRSSGAVPWGIAAWVQPPSTGATTSANWSLNTWHHCAAVFASSTSRSAYLDGGNKDTDTTAETATGFNRTLIGGTITSGAVAQHMSGMIAEAGIWNVALTDAEIAALATGISPLAVRPQSLIVYVPLVRDVDEDLVGGLTFTANGSPTIADHPPVYKLWTPTQYDFGYISRHARLGWRNQHQVLNFAADKVEHSIFKARMPLQYGGNGIELGLHYSMASATSGNVKWGAAFERIPDSALDIDTDSFGDFNYRDIEVPGVSGNVGIARIRFLDGVDMDSVGDGELFRLKIIRDGESDFATGDAELHSIEMRELV